MESSSNQATNTNSTTMNSNSNVGGKSNSHTSSNHNNNKKPGETDLKSSIIKFMRDRPFLWNSRHPNYKDHKRREQEFQEFGAQIDCSVPEIKRVWHVLRTNFFRAHKLIMDRPQGALENGEKLWKYYLAMEYILEGTDNNSDNSRETRLTRSTRSSKDLRLIKIAKHESNNNANGRNFSLTNSNFGVAGSANCSRNSSNLNQSVVSLSNSMVSHHSAKIPTYNDSSLDADDDHLYARSLTSTLKKFDPTTREIIKLKFQEIIVNYMQQQQQQQLPSHSLTNQPAQHRLELNTSLEPPTTNSSITIGTPLLGRYNTHSEGSA